MFGLAAAALAASDVSKDEIDRMPSTYAEALEKAAEGRLHVSIRLSGSQSQYGSDIQGVVMKAKPQDDVVIMKPDNSDSYAWVRISQISLMRMRDVEAER